MTLSSHPQADDNEPLIAVGRRRSSIRGNGASERHSRILELIDQRGWVTTEEISRELGVSAVTARHDLSVLSESESRRIKRTRGGARLVSFGGGGGEPDFETRLRQDTEAKRRIAVAAAGLLGDAQIISLDASTSCFYLAQALSPRSDMFVVTNGLRTAEALVDRPGISVIVVGGVLRGSAMSMIGEVAEEQVGKYQVEVAFFGSRAFSHEYGLMDFAPEEARVKRSMAAVAGRIIGLVDHTKIGRLALLPPVVPTDRLSAIVTDRRPSDDLTRRLRDRNVELVLASKD
jgi:DeoR/GlpR family transcriptional regulator of sugar metabolism